MTETSPHLLGDITLQDRVILITGAGSGISLALAKLTLQQGAKILIADLKLTDEASDFVNSNTSSVKFQQCDVTKWPELEALFPTSISTFGDVPDIVVPGAGVFDPPWSNFWSDVETESYKEVEINMNHVVKLTRLAFRAFVGRKKKGVVCSIASQAGLNAFYLTPLYCATKHAVVGFTRALAPAEPLEGIKVVTVCPGIAKTPILGDALRDALKVDDISEDRLLTTEDIAHAMVEVITKGQYGGGTCLEISAERGNNVVLARNHPSASSGPISPITQFMYSKNATVPHIFANSREALDKDRASPFPPLH